MLRPVQELDGVGVDPPPARPPATAGSPPGPSETSPTSPSRCARRPLFQLVLVADGESDILMPAKNSHLLAKHLHDARLSRPTCRPA
ncbi:hypothetical protein [Streptomyces canus]|uniref:hypothetical protein n=1 Tax=Streptomyces canus TaxID=58343 RepID=UPI0027D8CA03|nr:hypothetical protein [Streptomyces canus]